jgi:hypothetical protein
VSGLSPPVASPWIARAKRKNGGRRNRPQTRKEHPALRDVDLHEICPGVSPSYSRAISTVISGACNFRSSGSYQLRDACRLRTLKASNVTPTFGQSSSAGLHHRPACQLQSRGLKLLSIFVSFEAVSFEAVSFEARGFRPDFVDAERDLNENCTAHDDPCHDRLSRVGKPVPDLSRFRSDTVG